MSSEPGETLRTAYLTACPLQKRSPGPREARGPAPGRAQGHGLLGAEGGSFLSPSPGCGVSMKCLPEV